MICIRERRDQTYIKQLSLATSDDTPLFNCLQRRTKMDAYIYNALELDEIRLLELYNGGINTELDANLRSYRLPDDEEPGSGHQVFLTRDGGFNVPNAPRYQAWEKT